MQKTLFIIAKLLTSSFRTYRGIGLLLPRVVGLGTTSTAKDVLTSLEYFPKSCIKKWSLLLTIMPVFTLVHVNRSALRNRSVLFSVTTKKNINTS